MLSKEIQEEDHYEWEAIWEELSKEKFKTSQQNSQKRAFWFKLIHQELPTLDNLAIRRPEIYQDHQNCPRCLCEKETTEHLFTCTKAKGHFEKMWTKTKEDLLKTKGQEKDDKVKGEIIKVWENFKTRAKIIPLRMGP